MSQAREERCPTKIRYESWDEAEHAAQQAILDQQSGKLPKGHKAGCLMAYRCTVCDAWHIGHFTAHVVRKAWSQRGAVTIGVLPRDWGIPTVKSR